MKTCTICQKRFKPNSNIQKVCLKCRTFECEICRKPVIPKQYQEGRRFCSPQCWGKWKTQNAIIECKQCNKKFVRQRKTRLFCSRKCQWIDLEKPRLKLSRENHWNWRGGITSIHKKLRRSKKYEEWRKSVYRRDNWTCQRCNKRLRSKDIIAHHIMEFVKYKKLRYELKNGVTLCRSCHLLIHRNPALLEAVKEVLEK